MAGEFFATAPTWEGFLMFNPQSLFPKSGIFLENLHSCTQRSALRAGPHAVKSTGGPAPSLMILSPLYSQQLSGREVGKDSLGILALQPPPLCAALISVLVAKLVGGHA